MTLKAILILLLSLIFQGYAQSASIDDIAGSWTNNYGSTMQLTADEQTGFVSGTYSSTTGSSGTYRIVGTVAQPSVADSHGLPVALSIWWHSTSGRQGDPSCAWFICPDATLTLQPFCTKTNVKWRH